VVREDARRLRAVALTAEHARPEPADVAARAGRLMPGVRVEILEGAGHDVVVFDVGLVTDRALAVAA
jgi:hypothetical protein